MTQMLAKIQAVHFSISGHLTALKRVKAEAMLQQVCLQQVPWPSLASCLWQYVTLSPACSPEDHCLAAA